MLQLRQIALVARVLKPAIDDLEAVFGFKRCYVDPEVATFGLENTLMTVGRNFLEVVAPTRDGTAGGRYLDRRGGDGGYMVITQAPTLDEQKAVRQRALDRAVRVAYEVERDGWHICQLHPRDLEAAFLEVDFDPEADLTGQWMPAGGHGWEVSVDQSVTVDYLAAELQAADPEALAQRWGAIIGVPVDGYEGAPALQLRNAWLRFVPSNDGRGAGLGGVVLSVRDRDRVLRAAHERGLYVSDDRVDVCGTRFYLRDHG